MAEESNPIKVLQNRFGRKEVKPGDMQEISNLESQASRMYDKASNEFEESLKVEGVQSTVDSSVVATNYEALSRTDAIRIETFFRNMTKYDFEKYEEIEQSEGVSSGGEPFKCYAEIDDNGNIIVTPNKIISLKENQNGSKVYTETREQSNGDIVSVEFKEFFGDILGSNITVIPAGSSPEAIKKFNKLQEFYTDPNNAQKFELSGKSIEEQSVYLQELQKLGITNANHRPAEELSAEEYKSHKENGTLEMVVNSSRYSSLEGFSNVSAIYSGDNDIPESVWTSQTGANGENLQFNSYRLTNDGRYIDTSSFRIVNGEPQYDLITKEELDRKITEQGINISRVYKTRETTKEQLQNGLPKEAESIAKHAERMKQREKTQEEIDDDEPQLPSFR